MGQGLELVQARARDRAGREEGGEAINRACVGAGFAQAHGDLLPDDTILHVRALTARYRHVGMIGDGVNDAPAIAAASIGIAMGKAGTDTAIGTADVALMQDDLSKVAEAVALGRRTVRIIQFNIAFALAIKAVFLVLALLGKTNLWLAIAADTGATLLVIANALRLLRGNGAAVEAKDKSSTQTST